MIDGAGFEAGLEWIVSCVYDSVESRFGRVAALLVGLSVGIALLALIVGAVWYSLVR